MFTFSRQFEISWSHVDANRHLGNTQFNVFATDARVSLFRARGLDSNAMLASGVGPVVLSDTISYLREAKMGEILTIHLRLLGLSPEGGRWKLRHTFLKENGVEAARIDAFGGFLDLQTRKLVPAPQEFVTMMRDLEHSEGFEELPALRR